MVDLEELPRDCCILCLKYLNGLEFLRFNILNKSIHKLSSTNYLNHFWVSYLKLSDSIRAATYPSAKSHANYSEEIGREKAIRLLQLRCQFCRVNTAYVNEFSNRRVCEACEKEKKRTIMKLITEQMAIEKGSSQEQLATIPSIIRGIGNQTVRLYLSVDVDFLLGENSSSSEEVNSEEEDCSKLKWFHNVSSRRMKRKEKHQSKRNQVNMPRRAKRGQAKRGQTSWQNKYRHRWSSSQKSKSSSLNEKMYNLSLSGLSCLILRDLD
jgi:hypothetical protein